MGNNTSEDYGVPLASCLDAEFIPVDPLRERFRISGTEVRKKPYRYWHLLTSPVKKYYRKRVCVCGPESTGKTTLSKWLVATLNRDVLGGANLVPEFARTYIENRGKSISQTDILNIARGQKITENLVFDDIAPLQIIDTGVPASQVWNEFLFGDGDSELYELCEQAEYDLYLLCSPDVPWVKDDVRFLPNESNEFYKALKYFLQRKTNAKIVVVSGSWENRNQQALIECKALLNI